MAQDRTRTVRCVCGGSFYVGDVCHRCSGDGLPPARTQKPEEPYTKEIRKLIHRALQYATLGEHPATVSVCRELEEILPGVGWASVADAFERKPPARPGPMAGAVKKTVEEVQF